MNIYTKYSNTPTELCDYDSRSSLDTGDVHMLYDMYYSPKSRDVIGRG